jgi:hypothetical protein
MRVQFVSGLEREGTGTGWFVRNQDLIVNDQDAARSGRTFGALLALVSLPILFALVDIFNHALA